jgi:hypothetical protein
MHGYAACCMNEVHTFVTPDNTIRSRSCSNGANCFGTVCPRHAAHLAIAAACGAMWLQTAGCLIGAGHRPRQDRMELEALIRICDGFVQG